MKENLDSLGLNHTQAVSKLTALLSQYLVPEYHALFSGLKKLAEKAYAPTDSGTPMVILETHP